MGLFFVYRFIGHLNSNLTASDELKFRFATDGEGNYGFLGADDSFIPFHKVATGEVDTGALNFVSIKFLKLIYRHI